MTPYLLNLLDLCFTLHALTHGGVELNPLMQYVPVMVAWKVVGVGAAIAVMRNAECRMQNQRAGKLAGFGLKLATAVYAAVCIYHFYFVFGGAFLWQSILPGMLS